MRGQVYDISGVPAHIQVNVYQHPVHIFQIWQVSLAALTISSYIDLCSSDSVSLMGDLDKVIEIQPWYSCRLYNALGTYVVDKWLSVNQSSKT